MRNKGTPGWGITLVTCLVVAGCSGPTAMPHDVPTYRGDAARTGVMPGPGPSGRPDVAWTFQAGAPFKSSPAVVGDAVIAVSTDGVVHALALVSGSTSWTAELGAEVMSASPLVVDGLVVVGDQGGTVHALDLASGVERWRTETDGPIDGAAAAIDGRILVATETGTAFALDPTTGAVAWRQSLPGAVTRSICAADGRGYFATSGGVLVALLASNGSVAWTAQVAERGDGGTPSAADGLVFAATGLAATGLDGPDSVNRGVVALEAATGAQRWRRTSGSGEVAYAPAVVDELAFIVAEDATVSAVDAATGVERWMVSTGAPNDALPSVWASTLYVATTQGSLQALDTSTGALLWQVPIVGIPYAPVVAGGLVLVGTNTGLLYGFGDPNQ